MFKRNGQPIPDIRNGVTADGVFYPWPISSETLAELGIVDEPAALRPDDRFHFVHDNGDGTFTAEIKPREQVEAMIWNWIKVERDRLTRDGGYLASGKWFHSDELSRIQQLGLVQLGANIPAGLQWKTMDGSFVAMTPALAGQVFMAAALSDTAIFAAAEAHRAALGACVDPTAYDWRAGWPAVFDDPQS
jgi:hypothetical protein